MAKELVNTYLKNDANLISNWNFDSSNSNDRVSTNNGTDTAITYNAGQTNFGNKAQFNGTTSLISIADAANLKPTGNFSISAWIKTATTGVNQEIFQSYSQNTSVAGIRFRVNSSNNIEIVSGKNTGATGGTDFNNACVGSSNICDNNWHFVVATWDGTNLRVYVDGNLEATTAWANAPVYAGTNYPMIGARNNAGVPNSLWGNGSTASLDDIALWSRVLTSTEITYLNTGVNSPSQSPSASISPSASLSPSSSASSSSSASISPSSSLSPSPSASISPSSSTSASLSPSSSASSSSSASISPSSSTSASFSPSQTEFTDLYIIQNTTYPENLYKSGRI